MSDPYAEFEDVHPATAALARLQQRGAVATNGYRTKGDVKRLRRQGYTPAEDGAHNDGNGVDLVPGGEFKSLGQLRVMAAREFGRGATVQVHNGTHVHVAIPGWHDAPDTTRADPMDEFEDVSPAEAAKARAEAGITGQSKAARQGGTLATTGQAHDGDTLRLTNGRNGRLFGADAYELQQSGRRADNSLEPLGVEARDFMQANVSPSTLVNPTGQSSYGRPVVTLGDALNDPGRGLIRHGLGLAEQDYLRGTPQFAPYMEAERLARFSRQGGHATNAETPSQFRHKDGPWKGAEPGVYGHGGEVVFWDERTPWQGLRDDIAKGYVAVASDPKAVGKDLVAYGQANGFIVDPDDAEKFIKARNKAGGEFNPTIRLKQLPKPLTDVGDGATGAALRGFGDPVNMLDELGGVADTLVPGVKSFDGPRENVWNSDRRFGDILWDNIDINRSILGHDDEAHPIARIGGQLASGLVAPAFGIGGVTARAGAKALEAGASEFAAAEIGKQALRRRLAAVGGGEGALAGFGAAEGNPLERLPNAALGGAIGAAGGYGFGLLNEHALSPLAQKVVVAWRKWRAGEGPPVPDKLMQEVAGEVAPILNEGAQNAGPTPGARNQPQGGVFQPGGNDNRPPRSPGPQTREQIVESNQIASRLHGEWQQGRYAPDPAKLDETIAFQEQAFARGEIPDDLRAEAEGTLAFLKAMRGPERERFAAMQMDDDSPELVGPAGRERDYLDLGPSVGSSPPIPEGLPVGRTSRMDEQASAEDIASAARGVHPQDVISTGSNRVESLDEAARANPGRFEQLRAPDEREALRVRSVRPANGGLYSRVNIRGPFDITKTLRELGGVKDAGGDLAAAGITNAPRKLEFGGNEQFLGKLIDNEKGMSLDDAGERLWEQGYFAERPTVAEVIDALQAEHLGDSQFLPDELSEVADFHSLQNQRYTIEQAASEGRPFVEERGVPATMEDLAANSPPATAYEDLPTMGGKVANINLSNVESKHDISRLLNTTESRFGGFDAARRGKITHAETEALASELGMRADDLLKRRKGQALNAEQALQARRILAKSSDEVVALAQKAKAGSEEELAAFQRGLIRHAAIQEQVTGVAAEAGRLLSQYRITAKASAHRERVIKAAIENMGGRDSLEDMAGMILEAQRDPAALNRFIAGAVKPTWKDKLVELWYNSLLSGPQTHAVNILSNTLTAALQLPEHLTAAAIGTTRNKVAQALGRKEVDRVLMSEIGPRAVGLVQGASEGLRAFRKTLRTGEVSDQVTKVESARQEAISGLKGKIIRVPTHLLSAEDEFFKATARRMEIAGLSVRKARSEGLKGDALKARIGELNANPTEDMVERSLDYARYLTFQRPLGPAMRHVQAVVQNHPWLKLFVPFIRTPTNILKFAVERSPAAPLLKEVRTALKAGGADRDLALARVGLGTGLGLLVAQWTADGTITGGGPADANAKRMMQADGWQPYSIRIGGKYYSYKRLDPLATTIGVVADAVNLQEHMTDKQRDKVGALIVSSVMRNLENKTWLSGLSDALEAIEEPERRGQAFIERLAGSVAVPALFAQTAKVIDPVARETSSESAAQGILDAIRARVPGASKGLQPRRDAFGEEVANEGGLGPDLASPIWTDTAKDDPVVREVLDSGATIGRLQNNVGGVKLPDAQFNKYQKVAGQLTHQYIRDEIQAPGWKALSGADKRKAIDGAKDAARSDARDAILQMEEQ